MGDFDLFTNEHVRNYFELKRNGQYEKALQELQIAADENDGQGLFIMGRVYPEKDDIYYKRSALAKCTWGIFFDAVYHYRGNGSYCTTIGEAFATGDNYIRGIILFDGYGSFNKNEESGREYMRKACNQNNPFAIEHVVRHYVFGHDDEYAYWVKRGAELGIPRCQWIYADTTRKFVEWYTKASLQKFEPAMNYLAHCYWNGNDCKQNRRKAIKLIIECKQDIDTVRLWLKQTTSMPELFVFGRELRNRYRNYIDAEYAIQVYQDSIENTQRAVFCFLLCAKEFLIKDVRLIIAKMIWEFREDPE